MSRIADQLREFVESYGSATYSETHGLTLGEYQERLIELADQIDKEHNNRMEQCRRETMRHCLHRVRSMMNDMEHGIKWQRRPETVEVDETATIEVITSNSYDYGHPMTIHEMECSGCGHTYEHVNGEYARCPHCGRRQARR